VLNPHIQHAIMMADNYQMNGEYDQAIQLYDEIIKIDPFNVNALMNKANALDHMGNHTEALTWYDSALNIDPDNAETWYNKGVTLKKTGSDTEGLFCIRKGIALAMGDCIENSE
jgi:tetratricopeptide (TPR) repeat protein